jgi:ubiquinone/menaquinone biosynthesis C-methylase UbiE
VDAYRSVIRDDFNLIALLSSKGWNHNNHYHDYLLRYLPASCEVALDVGCGTGIFSQELAKHVGHVLGLDLSPEMIRVAREQAGGRQNLEFRVADATSWEFLEDTFDCIASIATMHHLPMHEMLSSFRRALRPGGVLLILDLYQCETLLDYLVGGTAVPADIVLRLVKGGHWCMPRNEREAWAQHSVHDKYLTLREVREMCERILPGACVRRHLLWRYSLVWHK